MNDAIQAKLDEIDLVASDTMHADETAMLTTALRRAIEELNEVQILMKDRWSSKALRDIAKILEEGK